MTIAAQVPVVREALGVSSSYDSATIPAGIRRAILFMLRTWTFPQALVNTPVPIPLNGATIELPVSGVGKIHAVRLEDATGTLFKRLRRTLVGELPSHDSPALYYQEGNKLILDGPVTDSGYKARVWYNSISVDDADAWITDDFEDVVFTLSVMRLAQDLRKPEVLAAFSSTWQEQIPTLAQYLNEIEFNDLDIRLRPSTPQAAPGRYGT